MKLNRTLLIKGLSSVMELLSFLMKKELSKYTITVTDVVDAGKDSGMVVLSVIDSLKDRKLSPEETLELAERLTVSKRSLDKALTTLIKDLKDHAIEKTKEGNIDD
tara:strand:+ start:169 stop:486 length:318 start_codon:yes stop_codon:yes gene_type:complete